MSNTTPTPSLGADGSHFTVEDAGSTTDAADLFHNDTTAGLPTSSPATGAAADEDPIASADALASAGAERRTETETRPQPEVTDASSGYADENAEPSPAAAGAVATDRSDAPDSVPAPNAPAAPEAPSAPSGGLAALVGDDSIAHVFDQTNGVIDRLDGDSDGTAAADTADATDSRTVRPVGQQDAFQEDHYGADDGRDANP